MKIMIIFCLLFSPRWPFLRRYIRSLHLLCINIICNLKSEKRSFALYTEEMIDDVVLPQVPFFQLQGFDNRFQTVIYRIKARIMCCILFGMCNIIMIKRHYIKAHKYMHKSGLKAHIIQYLNGKN